MPRVTEASPRTAVAPSAAADPPPLDPNAPFDPMAFLGLVPLDEANEFTKVLFFGDAGTGKTTSMAFAANLPGDGITVIINVEGGLKKDALRKLGVDTSKVVIWPNREKGEEVTYDSLEKLLYQLRATIRHRPGSVKVTGFDSTTELCAALLKEITAYAYKKDQELPESVKAQKIADGKKLRDSPLETQIQDYGLLTTQVRTLMRGFRDLGCHLVLTALEKNDAENENGAKAAIGPELPNKVSGSIRGYVDLVLRLTSETVKTGANEHETLIKAETKQSLTRQCKDRDGALPFEMLTPTFDRIHAYVKGELTEETDPEIARHREIRDKAEKFKTARKRAA